MKLSKIVLQGLDGKKIDHQIHKDVAQAFYSNGKISDLDLAIDMYADKDVTLTEDQIKSLKAFIENERILNVPAFVKKALLDFIEENNGNK